MGAGRPVVFLARLESRQRGGGCPLVVLLPGRADATPGQLPLRAPRSSAARPDGSAGQRHVPPRSPRAQTDVPPPRGVARATQGSAQDLRGVAARLPPHPEHRRVQRTAKASPTALLAASATASMTLWGHSPSATAWEGWRGNDASTNSTRLRSSSTGEPAEPETTANTAQPQWQRNPTAAGSLTT